MATFSGDFLNSIGPSNGLGTSFKTGAGSGYLTFETDIGGFNNIRMQFEYLCLIAAISGRTLVLPAADPWYLINWGPISPEGDIDGVSHHSDFFNIANLNLWIDVISTDEFI